MEAKEPEQNFTKMSEIKTNNEQLISNLAK